MSELASRQPPGGRVGVTAWTLIMGVIAIVGTFVAFRILDEATAPIPYSTFDGQVFIALRGDTRTRTALPVVSLAVGLPDPTRERDQGVSRLATARRLF